MLEEKFDNLKLVNKISDYSVAFLQNEFDKKILLICQEDDDIEKLAANVRFFSPNKNIIIIPNSDNIPYSSTSPTKKITLNRIKAFNDLNLLKSTENLCVITTIGALLKKISQESYNNSFTISIGQNLNREILINFLIENGYHRLEIAYEAGDFAVRGDIIDIVCAESTGWRIDFFGSKVEKIRSFNCDSQISSQILPEITIVPCCEVILNQHTIKNFKENLVKFESEATANYQIYQEVINGRYFPGIENFLPLFYDQLSSILNFFTPEIIIAHVNLLNQVEQFLTAIEQQYQARQAAFKKKFYNEIPLLPISKEMLWLKRSELFVLMNRSEVILHQEFSQDCENLLELNMSMGENFFQKSKREKVSVYDLLKKYRDTSKKKLMICCKNEVSLSRTRTVLEANNFHCYLINNFPDCKNLGGKSIGIGILDINQGFNDKTFAFIAEQDLFGEKIYVKKSTNKIEKLLNQANNLSAGEYIVHRMHGIGLFEKLETLTAGGMKNDYLKLIYHGGDILYIPVVNFDILTKYGVGDNTQPNLDKLGGVSWNKKKEKLQEKLLQIANNLINIAAERSSQAGEIFIPQEKLYQDFCNEFPYVETEDQLAAIQNIQQDLASGIPMDRLICGDVGFGKTEVAMRAAFTVCFPENKLKKQVVIVVPTTLLARQHYHSFCRRFENFNINIKQLSRLVSPKDAALVKQGIADGLVDIVIATHAIFAKSIKFANLGLLIIDEEHHFGVLHKEKLKELQKNVHILTLSATPIPRTLQMSLTGIRDLSLIATPPMNRQVVKNYIIYFDPVVIREAIIREYYRGGQVFFVCPRISEIEEIYPQLMELVPEIKIKIAHGQMKPDEIEEIINDFYLKKFDLLLATTIIESGIDIPKANTIFIYRSDKLGLAVLYQLRGRVGRSNIKAYSYLIIPNNKISDSATARLKAMETIDSLGAGFTVASHDMDIRGFGNLVGDEQSGHIKDIGIELYQQMLQEAVEDLRNQAKSIEKIDHDFSPQVNLNEQSSIPEFYIKDLNLRLSLYRSLANCRSDLELENLSFEMIDRFGQYPKEVDNLIKVIGIKILCYNLGIEKIELGEKISLIQLREVNSFSINHLIKVVEQNQSYIKLKPGNKFIINKPLPDIKQKLRFVYDFIKLIQLPTAV